MNKKLIAILAVLLSACMLFTACTHKPTEGGSSSTGSTVSAGEPVNLHLIFICWGYADTMSMTMKKTLVDISEGLKTLAQPINVDWEWIVAWDSEEALSKCEAFFGEGVDGIMTFIMTETICDIFTENEIPFVNYNRGTEEAEANYAQSPYYVARQKAYNAVKITHPAVEALINAGCKEIALLGPAPGTETHDLLFREYQNKLAEYPDIIVHESQNDNPRADTVNELLALYPNLDGICDTGATGGFGDGILQALRTNGLIGQVKYASFLLVDDTVSAFEEGSFIYTSDDGGIMPGTEFVALLNYIMGTPLSVNGPFEYDRVIFPLESTDDVRELLEVCYGEESAIPFEAYVPYFKWINPDATGEGFMEFFETLDFDTVKALHE